MVCTLKLERLAIFWFARLNLGGDRCGRCATFCDAYIANDPLR